MSSRVVPHVCVPAHARLVSRARLELEAALPARDGPEACGVLIGRWQSRNTLRLTGARALRNTSNSRDSFFIEPEDILAAARTVSTPPPDRWILAQSRQRCGRAVYGGPA